MHGIFRGNWDSLGETEKICITVPNQGFVGKFGKIVNHIFVTQKA
jgi:hypothetical protein